MYHWFLPCRTVISALVKMMKEKKWAHRVLRKQGQTCYSHGPSGGERKAKAVNWVQFFFFLSMLSMQQSDVALKTQRLFDPPSFYFWKWYSHYLTSRDVGEPPEGNSTEHLEAFLGGFQLHFLWEEGRSLRIGGVRRPEATAKKRTFLMCTEFHSWLFPRVQRL